MGERGPEPVEDALAGVAALYTSNLDEHGINSKSVGWPDSASQLLRFEKLALLLDAAPHSERVSVADFGCGYAPMLRFLDERDRPPIGRYIGYDISAEMLKAARREVGADPRVELVHASEPAEDVDYTFVSGTFNVRMGSSEADWELFVKGQLRALWQRSRRGLAFNLLTTYVDWRKDDLFYASASEFFDYCKSGLSRFVSVVHDYPLYEWTMLVHREPV
jgi:SAM-dependent methyltransferase